MSDTLSPEEVYDVLIQAGFTGHAAIEGTAVALAESSGRATAIGGPNTDGTKDYGLFQINHSTEPGWDWQNPLVSAQMAKKIYDAHGWGRWATWTNGSYKLHLPQAQQAARDYTAKFNASQDPTGHYNWNPINDIQVAGKKGAAAAGGFIQDKLAPLEAFSNFLGTVGGAIGSRAFWVKAGIALIGFFLIVGGAIAMLKPAASNVAGRVVPV